VIKINDRNVTASRFSSGTAMDNSKELLYGGGQFGYYQRYLRNGLTENYYLNLAGVGPGKCAPENWNL
jgi:hypothetical protein